MRCVYCGLFFIVLHEEKEGNAFIAALPLPEGEAIDGRMLLVGKNGVVLTLSPYVFLLRSLVQQPSHLAGAKCLRCGLPKEIAILRRAAFAGKRQVRAGDIIEAGKKAAALRVADESAKEQWLRIRSGVVYVAPCRCRNGVAADDVGITRISADGIRTADGIRPDRIGIADGVRFNSIGGVRVTTYCIGIVDRRRCCIQANSIRVRFNGSDRYRSKAVFQPAVRRHAHNGTKAAVLRNQCTHYAQITNRCPLNSTKNRAVSLRSRFQGYGMPAAVKDAGEGFLFCANARKGCSQSNIRLQAEHASHITPSGSHLRCQGLQISCRANQVWRFRCPIP